MTREGAVSVRFKVRDDDGEAEHVCDYDTADAAIDNTGIKALFDAELARDRADVAELTSTTPYTLEEVQRARDHLKLALEAAVQLAGTYNYTLDHATHVIGRMIKKQAQEPGDLRHLIGTPIEFRTLTGAPSVAARFAGAEVCQVGPLEANPIPAYLEELMRRAPQLDEGQIMLYAQTSEPTEPKDGDMWFREDLGMYQERRDGKTRTLLPPAGEFTATAQVASAEVRPLPDDPVHDVMGALDELREVAQEELKRRRLDRTCCGSQLVDTATPTERTPTPGCIDRRECSNLTRNFWVDISELERPNQGVAAIATLHLDAPTVELLQRCLGEFVKTHPCIDQKNGERLYNMFAELERVKT